MNTRTLALVGVIALIGPGTVAAQEHKCACCAKGGARLDDRATRQRRRV